MWTLPFAAIVRKSTLKNSPSVLIGSRYNLCSREYSRGATEKPLKPDLKLLKWYIKSYLRKHTELDLDVAEVDDKYISILFVSLPNCIQVRIK